MAQAAGPRSVQLLQIPCRPRLHCQGLVPRSAPLHHSCRSTAEERSCRDRNGKGSCYAGGRKWRACALQCS